jgi:DNA polymerase-3 subunit epsilon
MTWNDGPLLGFDLETTGVNPCSDLPVQVALVRWEPSGAGYRNVFIVNPGCEVPSGAEAVHGISTSRARREGCPLGEAVTIVHAALKKAQADHVPVVAMNASFDVTIAAMLFRSFGLAPIDWGALVDPLVIDRQVDRCRCGNRRLDALCETYDIVLGSPHDAGSDADATLALARKIAERHPEIASFEIGELTKYQAEWHRSWALEYDSWCRDNGKPGLAPEEFCWPLREVLVPTCSPAPMMQTCQFPTN